MKTEGGRMNTKPEDLKTRTKRFALDVIRLYALLPKTPEAQVLGKQMIRSGTSVGAHYRESLRSRSDAEVISKLEVALQELEETQYWLELIVEAGIAKTAYVSDLVRETDELTAILVTCVKKIKLRTK
jgi:four helix bundle protein